MTHKKPRLRLVKGKRTVRLTTLDRQYFAELHRFVDELFEAACDEYDWSWAEFAEAAQLCEGTVNRLGNRQTLLPRFQTIFKLAKAVGREIKFQKLRSNIATRGLKAVG